VAPSEPPAPSSPGTEPEPWSADDFAPVVAFLRARIGITLEPHRMGLMQARLRSRLQVGGFPSFVRFYERVLKADPNGWGMQLLIDLSTVNHTAFFREAGHFTFLAQHLLPAFKDLSGGPVRIWSAGCSTGQEPYSMAMVLAETVPNLTPQRVEILASDLSLEVVQVAARAMYKEADVRVIPPPRLRRFFLRGRGPRDGQYKVVPEIRDLVKFKHLDLRNPIWAVPNDFHAILCRNVSIYFAEDERVQLLNRLAGHLRPGGWLVMGNGEILPAVPSSLRKTQPSIFQKVE
jgi:chemotaxis protein methyltransferase CheR